MKPNILVVVAVLFVAGWLGMGAATLVGLSKLPGVSQLQPAQPRPTFYADEIVVTAPLTLSAQASAR
jgi:hypothetical protein